MINSYFDLLKVLGKHEYNEVSSIEKSKNAYMVNRHLTRLYPELCSAFSHIKSNPIAVMDLWHSYFKKIYSFNKNPLLNNINFAKLANKSKELYTIESMEYMISSLRLGTEEVKILLKLNNKELIKYLNDINNLIDEKIKK